MSVTAALSLTAFGLVNAVAILASTASSATAFAAAHDHALSPSGATAQTVQLMYQLDASFFAVGALFFGLWLIPMGRLVLISHWMPRPLGWLLIIGGVSYVVSVFVTYLAPGAPAVGTILTGLATIGELWMLGYLIIVGVRRQSADVPEVKTAS